MYAEVTGEIRMSQRRQSMTPTTDLEFHASGFMVKVHGSSTDASLKQFRHFLHLRALEPTDDQLMLFWPAQNSNISKGSSAKPV